MRVLVDTSYLDRGPSGTGVYIDRLVRALAEEGSVELVQVRQRRRLALGAGNRLRSAANVVLDGLWLHVGLPRAARLSGAEVVHHPLPAHGPRIGVPQVSTVHDVAFAHMAGAYDPAWRAVASRTFRAAARRNAALVCVSETTAADAVAVLGADPARIVVAPHGPGQVEPGTPPSEVPGNGHLLFVGDAEPRKNLTGLLEAYASYRADTEDPAPLVLAGASAAAAGGSPGVEGRPAPARDELVGLLRGARALVHPSLHEGFGLTLLEAMALGVPVVAVASDGAREVCGDAALLVAPDELGPAVARVAGDADLRADLSARGRERAGGFSWAASARAHERAYTLACGAPVRADLP